MIAGPSFGRSDKELASRLCFVDFNGKKALETSKNEEVNLDFVKKYCKDTIEGVEKVCEWCVSLK